MYFGKITDAEARLMNPLVLAFVGDAVHSMYVRHKLATQSDAKSHALHLLAAGEVNASAQSLKAAVLEPLLTEEEADVFRRGRNAKQHTVAKNAELNDYKRASGFEALLGYLYLTGREERIKELLSVGADERGSD